MTEQRNLWDNKEMEAYILERLPATFGMLVGSLPAGQYDPLYRKVDGGLQRLRKRGVIAFELRNNRPWWFEKDRG